MSLRKIKNTWYSYFRDENGRRHMLSTGCTDKREAEKVNESLMSTVHGRRVRRLLEKHTDNSIHTSVVKSDVQEKVQENTHKRGTAALSSMFDLASSHRPLSGDHKAAWTHFCEHIKVKYADEVTSAMCLDYLNRYFEGKRTKTWNNHKSLCNTVFRLTLVETGLPASPFAPILNKLVNDTVSHRNLTDQEIDQIMESGDLQIKVMVMLSRWTAQRLETCAKMAFSDFDFEKKVFLAEPGKTKRFGKFVCVPIFPELEKFLSTEIKPIIHNPDIPIVNDVSDYASNKLFSQKFMRFLDKLCIKSDKTGTASFHSIRGSAITWLKDQGISSDVRRAITGHSNLSIEDIYARSVESVSLVARTIKNG